MTSPPPQRPVPPPSWIANHPGYLNALIIAVVALHAVMASRVEAVDVFGALAARGQTATLITLHVVTASLASLVAGFAGVVVIFGLSSESERFRRLRLAAGRNLRANWTSVITAALLAAFVAWGDVVLSILGHDWAATVGTEAAIVLSAHAAVRLRWLLRRLTEVVAADDYLWGRQENQVNPASLFPDSPDTAASGQE